MNTKSMTLKIDALSFRWISGSLILLVAALLVAGCAGTYGRLKTSPEVSGAFAAKRMLADYHYFYDGRETLPYAIIGIKNGYTLASKFWTPIPHGDAKFAKLVEGISASSLAYAHGSYILDPDGNSVGIWFSTVPHATVEFLADRRVRVYSPYSPASRSSFVGHGRY